MVSSTAAEHSLHPVLHLCSLSPSSATSSSESMPAPLNNYAGELLIFITMVKCFHYVSLKRVRKMKERYLITEMRKQANRMSFGKVCMHVL